MPYEKIMQAALFGRGVPMWGATNAPIPAKSTWPQPYPYAYTIWTPTARKSCWPRPAAASASTLIFDAGSGHHRRTDGGADQGEPGGHRHRASRYEKVPGANFRGELMKKTAPMVVNRFGGWLDWPDYYFFWNLHSSNAIFNTANYQNKDMDKLIDGARFTQDSRRNTPPDVRGVPG